MYPNRVTVGVLLMYLVLHASPKKMQNELYRFTSSRNFSKVALGTQPWHLSRFERAEDFGLLYVSCLVVDRGKIPSCVVVLCSCVWFLCYRLLICAAVVVSLEC